MPTFWQTRGRFSGGSRNPQFGGASWKNFVKPLSSWYSKYGPPGSSDAVKPWGKGHIEGGLSYTPNMSAANLSMDPMEIIKAQLPAIQEQQNKAFAAAGARYGAAGMLGSGGTGTGYAGAGLGEASRRASNDIAALYMNIMGQAAENQAAREMQARQTNAEQAWEKARLENETGRQLGEWDVNAMRDWFGAGQGAFGNYLDYLSRGQDRELDWERMNRGSAFDFMSLYNQMLQARLGREGDMGGGGWGGGAGPGYGYPGFQGGYNRSYPSDFTDYSPDAWNQQMWETASPWRYR